MGRTFVKSDPSAYRCFTPENPIFALLKLFIAEESLSLSLLREIPEDERLSLAVVLVSKSKAD